MGKKHAVMVAVCLIVCVATGSAAIAGTVKSGAVTYWDYHYLAGQPVQHGFDVFGWNYGARVYNGYHANIWLPRMGLPPYEGDLAAYLERLSTEFGIEDPCTYICTVLPSFYERDTRMLVRWNEAYLGSRDYDGDGYLDWQPFTAGVDHCSPPAGWRGSGAVLALNKWSPAGGRLSVTWVAVPDDAWYQDEFTGCDDPTYCDGVCRWWYDAQGDEIGYSWANWPVGDNRFDWAVVKMICHCYSGEQVFHYESPSYPPGIGGPR